MLKRNFTSDSHIQESLSTSTCEKKEPQPPTLFSKSKCSARPTECRACIPGGPREVSHYLGRHNTGKGTSRHVSITSPGSVWPVNDLEETKLTSSPMHQRPPIRRTLKNDTDKQRKIVNIMYSDIPQPIMDEPPLRLPGGFSRGEMGRRGWRLARCFRHTVTHPFCSGPCPAPAPCPHHDARGTVVILF